MKKENREIIKAKYEAFKIEYNGLLEKVNSPIKTPYSYMEKIHDAKNNMDLYELKYKEILYLDKIEYLQGTLKKPMEKVRIKDVEIQELKKRISELEKELRKVSK